MAFPVGACRIAISRSLCRSTLSVGLVVCQGQEAAGSGGQVLMGGVADTAVVAVAVAVVVAGVGDEGLEDTRSQDTKASALVVETKTGDAGALVRVPSADSGEEAEVVVVVDSSMVLSRGLALRGHKFAGAAHCWDGEDPGWEVLAQAVTGEEVEDENPNLDGDANGNANQSVADAVLSGSGPFLHPYQAHATHSLLRQSPDRQR